MKAKLLAFGAVLWVLGCIWGFVALHTFGFELNSNRWWCFPLFATEFAITIVGAVAIGIAGAEADAS